MVQKGWDWMRIGVEVGWEEERMDEKLRSDEKRGGRMRKEVEVGWEEERKGKKGVQVEWEERRKNEKRGLGWIRREKEEWEEGFRLDEKRG